MKKSKLFQFFLLLIIFVAILAGCGSGGGGKSNPQSSTIQFLMPDIYEADGKDYAIPAGEKVQFYTLTEDTYTKVINEKAPVEADYVFTGTTRTPGDSDITLNLPDLLKNQKRYIFAVVEMGNTSYDLRGKTTTDAKEAATNGVILLGQASGLVTLTSGGRISIIKFEGKAEGEPVKSINFTMADTYITGESELPIPNDKEVTFYCVTGEIGNTFSTDAHMFTGTTGINKTTKARLPESLVGQNCYFYAVVNLKGFYDLRGKTADDVQKAISSGQVLFGQSMDPVDPSNKKMYSLSDGINIDNFVFRGPTPDGVINFVMPKYCVTGTPIPSGKPVKFYSVTELDEIINADHVFTGTTGDGGIIELTLPGWLIGQGRFFVAVVNLKGTFDLQGKSLAQVIDAVQNGVVLFGESNNLSSPDELYTLADGINIDNFEFKDAAALGGSKIVFTIPDKYKGPSSEEGADDGGEFDIPVGKSVKFYAITEDAYNSANGGAAINGELIHEGTTGGSNIYTAELPDHLIDQERYFLALIILSETETFDLRGMKVTELTTAMSEGKVLYGRHLRSEGEIELLEIADTINEVDNFEFMGKEP